jgi:hypothetical protein
MRSRDHVPSQRGASGEASGGQRRRFARASSCGCAARGPVILAAARRTRGTEGREGTRGGVALVDFAAAQIV